MWQWIVQWILAVIASKGGPNVAVYSAVDNPVIIASKGGPNVAVYRSATEGPPS